MSTFRSTTVLRLIVVAALALAGAAFAQDGEALYNQNCAACHQGNGMGIPSAFPPLAGHTPEILAVEGGRSYLIHVLLYGLQGEITVEGAAYNGAMPGWQQLDDATIAAILTYIATGWDNEAPEGFEPFTAEEIAEARDQGLSPQDVYAMRSELALEGE